MFKNFTYKQKLKLLLPVTVVSLFLIYVLGLSKTLALRSEIKEKQEKLILSKDVNSKIGAVRSKIAYIDDIVGNDLDSTKSVMDIILENITTYCSAHDCTVREIPVFHSASDRNFDIDTYFITIEGNYHNLLNLVFEMEQKKKSGGRLSSVLFFTRKNNTTKKLSLELTLYIQQYNKING